MSSLDKLDKIGKRPPLNSDAPVRQLIDFSVH